MTYSGKQLAGEMGKWAQAVAESQKRIEAFIATQPAAQPCPKHPGIARAIDRSKTIVGRACYIACPECEAARLFDDQCAWLVAIGVPPLLSRASLATFGPRDNRERKMLGEIQRFTGTIKRGFVVLTGDPGAGKSWLLAAMCREFRSAAFRSQGRLLSAVRATYGRFDADDPVTPCKAAGFLALDEIGVSCGGRDESPMLYDLIDHRYGNWLPTAMASNLEPGALWDMLGGRLTDRIRHGLVALFTLNGQRSRREESREDYFSAVRPATVEKWDYLQ
jgi:hypothetical protein